MLMKADIKICGLRRNIDAEYVNKFEKIKYAGFIFAESKRKIDVKTALSIKQNLRPDIKAVGVFADMSADDVIKISKEAELDIIQLHSDENREYINKIKNETRISIWKSISVKDKKSLDIEDISDIVDCFLLDAYNKNVRGGSGKSFNWDLARDFSKNHFTALAGGINEENINQAYDAVKPDIIDLSSAVETDGFKDYKKIESLIRRII